MYITDMSVKNKNKREVKAMKRLILITAIAVYSLFAVAMLAEYNHKENPVVISLNETLSSQPSLKPEARELYVIKEDGGRVAVADGATGEVLKKTDTLVSILPEKDRDRLKKGIKVESKNELRLLLEDFCS